MALGVQNRVQPMPSQLSGDEQQSVAIERGLANRLPVNLDDELMQCWISNVSCWFFAFSMTWQ